MISKEEFHWNWSVLNAKRKINISVLISVLVNIARMEAPVV